MYIHECLAPLKLRTSALGPALPYAAYSAELFGLLIRQLPAPGTTCLILHQMLETPCSPVVMAVCMAGATPSMWSPVPMRMAMTPVCGAIAGLKRGIPASFAFRIRASRSAADMAPSRDCTAGMPWGLGTAMSKVLRHTDVHQLDSPERAVMQT